MIEVVKYLFDRLRDVRPATVEVGQETYSTKADGTLDKPIRALVPQFDKPVFDVQTLSALREAIDSKIDGFSTDVALHVSDYLTVKLVSTKADEFGRRHVFVEAKHRNECPFEFNKFIDAEKFLIDFRTSFYLNDEALKVLKVVSSLESGQTITMADDGLSQQIEIKTGTVAKQPVVLPADGIPLIPWRTFRDAAPVESKFLLRLKQVKDSLPQIALYEIDQKWKLDTVHSIGDWLRKHVKDVAVIA